MWDWLGGMWFGMQAVPKFDERVGHGGWTGTRDRGVILYQDLGVQISREGYPWRLDEPEPGRRPHAADLDAAVDVPRRAGIQVMLMCMDTPTWAVANGPSVADSPHALPRGLHEPIFSNGRDEAPPGVAVNPANPWACWMSRVAGRHRGRVAAYQIWNEPDFPSGVLRAAPGDGTRSWWGSVEDYARLLRVAARVVRREDPRARIVTGGLGYPAYLEALLARGSGSDIDVVDFHAYGGPTSDGAVRALLDGAAGFRQVLRKNRLARPLSCSEAGFPATDPAEQAAAVLKLFVTARTEAIAPLAWYAATNPSWRQMGLVDGWTLARPRGGYAAYRTLAWLMRGAKPLAVPPHPPQVVMHRFGVPRGEIRVAWAPCRSDRNPWIWSFPAGGWRVTARGATTVLSDERVKLTSMPEIWCSFAPALPSSKDPPGAPFMAGAVAIASVSASQSDPGGFHEAECAVDGDPDTEWLGRAGQPAVLTFRAARPRFIAALGLKTGPRQGAVRVEARAADGRWRPVGFLESGGDWGLERLEMPPMGPVDEVRLTWSSGREVPRLFHVDWEMPGRS